MSGSFWLEDFDGEEPVVDPAPQPEPEIVETTRVAAYEEGYKTGWDDAVRAAEEDRRSLGAELSRNLRDLNFSYHEARDELLASLRPFLSDLLEVMFPELLPEAAGAAIANDLAEQARNACSGKIQILVAPEDTEVVCALIDADQLANVEVAGEPALASGQVRITAEQRSVAIDAEILLTRLRDALSGTLTPGEEATDQPQEMRSHG